MTADRNVAVRVEIPKGSRNKYEWSDEHGGLVLDRRLFAAVAYPTEYGFIPGTAGEDGDPIDALVCVTESTFPGCIIPAKVVALLRMHHNGHPNHKVLCVPHSDPAWRDVGELTDLPGDLQEEIGHFFDVYAQLEGKDWQIEGWGDHDEALAFLAEARERKEREPQG